MRRHPAVAKGRHAAGGERVRAQVEELGAARAELARAKEKLRATKAAELERSGEETAGALAAEVAELRKANAALEEENLELALRLQDARQAAPSSVNPALEVIGILT